jgi:protocatechuate 3,4-dioxygenase beta subunit
MTHRSFKYTFFAVLFSMSVSLYGQGSAGSITGSITDQTGGALAGAMVTVSDVDRGINRTLTTDASGAYSAPNLTPGNYKVRAEFRGFKTIERQNIQIEVNQELRVDLSLSPGEQTQVVNVTEAIPLIETTNAELGGTLQNQVINDLPLNGRNSTCVLASPSTSATPDGRKPPTACARTTISSWSMALTATILSWRRA